MWSTNASGNSNTEEIPLLNAATFSVPRPDQYGAACISRSGL